MLKKFEHHLQKTFPYLNGKKILVAISGGVDSVVLTHLMHQLHHNISLAHCNFKLRAEESDKDESFIKQLSNQLSLDCFITSFQTEEYSAKNKKSIQIAARELRYNYFDELIKEKQFEYVLTAHHADDNLETFLINLSRGTGLDGLTGIPSRNGSIIRPLLTFSRDEILQYAKQNNIPWREDKSNTETKYIRNKIRHQIVPVFKEINPYILDTFQKTSSFLQESKNIINDQIDNIKKEIISKEKNVYKLNIQKLLNLKNTKAYLYQLLNSFGFTEWDNISELLYKENGKQIKSKNYILIKDRDYLLVYHKNDFNIQPQKKYIIYNYNTTDLDIPFNIFIKNTTKKEVVAKKSILVDKNLVFFPLLIRQIQEGDVFHPSGMKGKKKLSKFFKDEKMSLLEKKTTWLLCNKNNQIIWVIGKRQDKRFEINKRTKNIIRISI